MFIKEKTGFRIYRFKLKRSASPALGVKYLENGNGGNIRSIEQSESI